MVIGVDRLQHEYRRLCETLNRPAISRQSAAYRRIVQRMERLQERLRQPIQGWMGHADPFLMGPGYTPASGARRFLSGTPPVLGMLPLADMVALIDEVGMAAVREKSVALTSYAVDLADTELAEAGVTLSSPRDAAERGGHVTR